MDDDVPKFLKLRADQPPMTPTPEGPPPDKTDDAYECRTKDDPEWEGEWCSPCVVEASRLQAFRDEHAECCGGLDRYEIKYRQIFRIITAYSLCGASKEVSHDGHF